MKRQEAYARNGFLPGPGLLARCVLLCCCLVLAACVSDGSRQEPKPEEPQAVAQTPAPEAAEDAAKLLAEPAEAPVPSPTPSPTPSPVDALRPADASAYPVPTGERRFGPAMTLPQFLDACLKAQYFSSAGMYTAPPEGFEDKYYVELRPEPAVLDLATDVTAWHADEEGLALLDDDRDIHVFSPWPCSGLALEPPGREADPMPGVPDDGLGPLPLLSWSSSSPILAAGGADMRRVDIFDLRRCGRVARHAFGARPVRTALSPRGTWLAAVDNVHTLWAGPSTGQLGEVAKLRFEVLDMAFTPQEGVLMVADEGGWVTLWVPREKRLMDRFQVPGGPWVSARFDGPRLHLVHEDGTLRTWDLIKRQKMTPEKQVSPYGLKNGVLTRTLDRTRQVRHMRLGRYELYAWYSASGNVLRVQGPAGRERCYDAATGAPVPPCGPDAPLMPGADPHPTDWKLIKLDRDYACAPAGTRLVLADRIFQDGHRALYARKVGDLYQLWWKRMPRPTHYDPRPGHLPARTALAHDAPVVWEPVEQ